MITCTHHTAGNLPIKTLFAKQRPTNMIVTMRICRHEFTLDVRIEHLSRAVMCAKSCNLTTSASKEGEFLHELEEKMEVVYA